MTTIIGAVSIPSSDGQRRASAFRIGKSESTGGIRLRISGSRGGQSPNVSRHPGHKLPRGGTEEVPEDRFSRQRRLALLGMES